MPINWEVRKRRLAEFHARGFYVKQQENGRWGIFDHGKLVEGGWFRKDYAQDECDRLNVNRKD